MENIENGKVLKISRKKFKILIIVFIVLVLLVLGFLWLSSSFNHRYYGATALDSEVGFLAPSVPEMMDEYASQKSISKGEYYPNIPTIEDTREFMKTSYNSTIKTRDVKDTMRDVKSVINNADGRTDRINENEKNAYVSFIIPKSNFESFKNEIESIVHEKLITENISSENLLNQKQSIEEQQEISESKLAQLEKQQADLITKHNQTIASLNKEIASIQSSLTLLEGQIIATTDSDILANLQSQKTILLGQKANLNKQITTENSSFNINNEGFKGQINWVKTQLENIEKQDVKFTNNIETVNGYISVRWISLWQLTKIFSPIHPTIITIILAIILLYILKKTKVLPIVQFV